MDPGLAIYRARGGRTGRLRKYAAGLPGSLGRSHAGLSDGLQGTGMIWGVLNAAPLIMRERYALRRIDHMHKAEAGYDVHKLCLHLEPAHAMQCPLRSTLRERGRRAFMPTTKQPSMNAAPSYAFSFIRAVGVPTLQCC